MKILAIEFSTDRRSVAIVADGRVLSTAAETAGRVTHSFALINQALAEARLEREQIECLAIGLGPGSYTGIRAGIALAQGWQLVRPVRLLGISAVECLAADALAQGWFGRINFGIDAQRNELYLAGYDISSAEYREVAPLKLVTLEEARARAVAGEIMAGPEIARWFPEGRLLSPEAARLGLIAANRTEFVTGEKLEPIYLRETNFVKAPPPRIIPGT